MTLLATLLLPLTGCGAIGGSSDGDKAAKAISDSIMQGQQGGAGDVLSVKRKSADCIGHGLVDEIGTEKLQSYGFLTKDLKTDEGVTDVKMSPADAKTATDVLFGCTDVEQLMQDAMASRAELDAKTKACIDDALGEKALRSVFENVFAGKRQEASNALAKPLMKCVAGTFGNQ